MGFLFVYCGGVFLFCFVLGVFFSEWINMFFINDTRECKPV